MSRISDKAGSKSEWRKGPRKSRFPYGKKAFRNYRAHSNARAAQ